MPEPKQPFVKRGKKVCIIGAGSIGVYAAKWAASMGFEPVVYEQTRSLGGVWRQDNEAKNVHGSAYDSLHTNSSWELMAASDFPFPFKPSRHFPMHYESE